MWSGLTAGKGEVPPTLRSVVYSLRSTWAFMPRAATYLTHPFPSVARLRGEASYFGFTSTSVGGVRLSEKIDPLKPHAFHPLSLRYLTNCSPHLIILLITCDRLKIVSVISLSLVINRVTSPRLRSYRPSLQTVWAAKPGMRLCSQVWRKETAKLHVKTSVL